jgi:hypothetical protein
MLSLFSLKMWRKRPIGRSRSQSCLEVTRLEDRLLPSNGYLYVPTFDTNAVLRYDETSGAPAPSQGNTGATFVPAGGGGLSQPDTALVGPDGNLYVSSGFYSGSGFPAILRFSSTTGAPLPTPGNMGATFGDTATIFAYDSTHASTSNPFTVRTMLFGPDGNLYVSVGYDPDQGWVDRFDGVTGVYLGKFVSDDLSQNGGLANPQGMVFGPDKADGKLDLYVASSRLGSSNNDVKRYDGTTGQFLGEFVLSASGGLDHAAGITFGPDGNMYVASGGWGGNGGIFGLAAVLHYEGPASPDALPPGTFLGTFVQPGSGGLNSPFGVLFGPDGNADGHQDLYVSTFLAHGTNFKAKKDTSAILRYDGLTGSFIDAFVPFGSAGMDNPGYIAFTETDPTTLAYNDGRRNQRPGRMNEAVLDNVRNLSNVNFSAAYDQSASTSFSTVIGTATYGGGDFVAKTGTQTFAPGETTKTITITINGDSKKEADETFYLDLFGNSSNSLFSKNRGTGTILNDD